jgi:transposase
MTPPGFERRRGRVTLSNEERENPASGKRNDVQVRRFMTVPGIGPITALCYLAIIDDPTRFKRSRSVGAYVGLTSRRYASGEVDWTGRISKCGDAMLRSYLYEAAGVLLTRVAKWSVLKAWGMRVAKRSGLRKAKSRSLESSP